MIREGGEREQDLRLLAAQFLMRHNLRPGWHSQPCKGCEELTDSLAELLSSVAALRAAGQQEPTRPHGLVNELEREIIRLNKEISDWMFELRLWRGAWLRHLGGYIVPKHHEIDGFGLMHERQLKEAEERGRRAGQQEQPRKALLEIIRHMPHSSHDFACKLSHSPVAEDATPGKPSVCPCYRCRLEAALAAAPLNEPDYPGQEFYRTNNKTVARAEENWEKKNGIGTS